MKPVYIRPESTEGDRRVTCYVCGCQRSAEYPLAIRQQASGPYFPFLETHEPPDGAEPPQDGCVLSCSLCFSLLTKQWELYERDKVPPVKRIYWLKRVDNGPYTGVEVGVQSEYASQLLGLTPDPPVPQDIKRPGTSSGRTHHPPPPMVPPTTSTVMETKRARVLPPQAQTHTVPLPPPGVPPLPISLQVPQIVPQQEALDLTLDSRRGTKRSLPSDPPPTTLTQQPPQTEGLDLSMPDKNATTEVCYICGDHYKKGTLVDIYAKQQIGNCPFFPSLMLHSRPSKSRPMEASGRVQGCSECYTHFKLQWDAYELRKISHGDRNYSLRKRNIGGHDSTVFVCYKCRCEYPSSKLCLIYCRSNSENEPFYPFIEKLEPPEGASPISPQGMVQVCLRCSKAIPQEQKNLNERIAESNRTLTPEVKNASSEVNNSVQQRTNSPLSISTPHNSHVILPHPVNEAEGDEVACYLCHQSHHRQLMHWLPMVAEKSTSNGMYFLFLKFLPRMPSNTVIEDGQVLACRLCYQHLNSQWEEYEKENVPTEHRQFSLRAMPINSHSPRLTPGSRHGSPDGTCSIRDASSPQTFSSAIESHIKSENAAGKTSLSLGYIGQPLHTLEVVPANLDPKTPTLPVITTQHALNISVNCFVCSFHSKPGQTYALRSKVLGTEPFFPFLAKHQSAHPEARVDANCVLVCLCCFHSLILQWQQYEKAQVDHNARLYDTYNYTCFICSLKTYRKRLYLLPVKDYPFLKEHNRPPGGMVVDNGRSVVVCKDCYSSLKNQYLELERWGVPVEKRQYNWIQRPPPPEFQQELPTTGSKPSQGLTQGTLPVVAGARASSPGSHHAMSPEVLSQSASTGRASPRGSQGPIPKSSSAAGNGCGMRLFATKQCEETELAVSNSIPKLTTKVPSPVASPETASVGSIPSCFAPLQLKSGIARQGGKPFNTLAKRHTVAPREGHNSGDASSNGFSGYSFTSVDQSAEIIYPRRKFISTISREYVPPIKTAVIKLQHLEKDAPASSKEGLIVVASNPNTSSETHLPSTSFSPPLISPSPELRTKCS